MSHFSSRFQISRLISRFEIRTKLIVVFLLISLASITAVALVVNYQTSRILVEAVGTDLKGYASNQGIAAGNLLLHQIELLQSLSLNEILINKVSLANSLYNDDPAAIRADLAAKDAEWETAVETDRIAQIVLTNTAADELLSFRARFPDHEEIFITDRYGELLAATNLTSDYYQGDETWWQNAYNNGNGHPIIEMPQFDKSAQIVGLALAVPIYDQNRQTVIGILRTTYYSKALSDLIDSAELEKEQLYLDLLFPNNQSISSNTLLQDDYEISGKTTVTIDEITLYVLQTNIFEQISLNGTTYLAAIAPITTLDTNPLITNLGWRIIARQERQKALAPVTSQQRTIWLLAILIMGFCVIGALFAAQYLTRPILRLTSAAKQIRDGNLEIQAPVTSNDEIGELADTFNAMTSQLRHVISRLEEHRQQLEQRVAQRTAELEQQTKMLDVILSTTPTYFFVYDRQGHNIYASPSSLAAMGYSLPSEKSALQELPAFMPEQFPAELAQVFQTGQPITNEFQQEQAEQKKQFEYVLNPVYDNEDFISSIVVTIRDITEQRLNQERLWRSQKMESLGILAGGVAHDFNNLLVAMLGQTSLALRKMPPDAPAQKHVEKAVKAAKRAADLIKQMLAYSGKGQFAMEPILLNHLIQENSHLFESAISKKVQLQLRLADHLPLFKGDPGQMQQVVMNLILNAAEAIGENTGEIIISTYQKDITTNDDHYWQKTTVPLSPGKYVCLRVQDDGIGMDDLTLAKIFDPFFTTKFTGRGLGLAALLGIVRGHKGGLYVATKPNEGTIFELLFPIAEQETAVLAETAVPPLPQNAGTILIIDDEAPVRDAVIDILEMEHIFVLTAADGKAGIAIYQGRKETIDLILLDLSMPGLSGRETFQALRQVDPNVKIILSSGYHQGEVYRQFSGENVTDFLAKPYHMATLVQKIKQYL